MRIDFVDAVVQKRRPIVGDHGIQVLDQLVEIVCDDQWTRVSALAQKDLLKVAQRFLVLRQFADERVGIEPQQLTLLVVVLPAPPVHPRRIETHHAGCDSGVLRGTPLAAGSVVQNRRGFCQPVAILRLRFKGRTRGQHVAQVLRHALVHPQQRALLRRREVRLVQSHGTAILPIPRVRKLVRQQIGLAQLVRVVGKSLFAHAVV